MYVFTLYFCRCRNVHTHTNSYAHTNRYTDANGNANSNGRTIPLMLPVINSQ